MKKFFYASVLLALMAACGNNTETERATNLEEEVMAIHDSIMPKTDSIMSLKQLLKNREVEIKEGDSAMVKKAIEKLNSANEAMMQWMRQYDQPSDTLEQSKKKTYLKEQKAKIKKVKNKMLKSIEKANKILKDQ